MLLYMTYSMYLIMKVCDFFNIINGVSNILQAHIRESKCKVS